MRVIIDGGSTRRVKVEMTEVDRRQLYGSLELLGTCYLGYVATLRWIDDVIVDGVPWEEPADLILRLCDTLPKSHCKGEDLPDEGSDSI